MGSWIVGKFLLVRYDPLSQSLNQDDALYVRSCVTLQKLAEMLLHELNEDQYITGPVCPLPDKQHVYPKSFQLYFLPIVFTYFFKYMLS